MVGVKGALGFESEAVLTRSSQDSVDSFVVVARR